jgi:hypothetical protein
MSKTKQKSKEEVKYELTAFDRCDRCGVQAWVKATGVNGELLFCSHHYNKVKDSLSKWAFEVLDETDRLQEDRLTGSEN